MGGTGYYLAKMRYTIIFLMICGVAAGAGLTAEKLVDKPDNLSAGSDVTVIMRFRNPFGVELPIQLKDKNVLGNNGYDIQCLEYTLPADQDIILGLAAIQPFTAGEFTLDSAEITYTNPESGQSETARTEPINVSIKPGNVNGNMQGITTVYQCNGQSMKSTSMTSSNQQQAGQQQSQQQSGQQQQGQEDEQDALQKQQMSALQNHQMAQDQNALRQSMQKQAEARQQMEQEMQKALESQPQMQEMQQELMQQGFKETRKQLNPSSNDTGDFKYQYSKETGETAEISGKMDEGQLKSLNRKTSEDQKDLLSALNSSEEFRKYDEELRSQGYNLSEFSYSKKGNVSDVDIRYEKNGSVASITAEVVNQEVRDVQLDKEGHSLAWFLAGLAALMALVLVTRRKKTATVQIAAPVVEEDPLEHALSLLEQAEKEFQVGRMKEAYGMVSDSARYFCSNSYGDGKELTATEAISLSRKAGREVDRLKECLSISSLVEFAKYRPTREDFGKAVRLAREFMHS